MKAKYRLAQVIGARINRVRSGMPALKERFLSIIRTKLGTEKIAVRSLAKIRRSPRLYGTADCSQRVEPFHVRYLLLKSIRSLPESEIGQQVANVCQLMARIIICRLILRAQRRKIGLVGVPQDWVKVSIFDIVT